MKIATINFSGNVGKSLCSGQLLKPRLPKSKVFSIETINSGLKADGVKANNVAVSKFGDLLSDIMIAENAIIDIGSSNVEEFMLLLEQYDSSHEEIDCFLIPTVSELKAQIDTVNTIDALAKLGVEPDRIKLVFNKVKLKEKDEIESNFLALFNLHKSEKSFVLNHSAVIFLNEIFQVTKLLGKSVDAILNDKTDYRALFSAAKTQAEKHECTQMIGYQRLAKTASANLDQVFDELFGLEVKAVGNE